MSATTIIALILQASFSIIALVQSNPLLPQPVRDSAIQEVQHALQLIAAASFGGGTAGSANLAPTTAPSATTNPAYTDPQRVTIEGYTGSAEVPVLTPDGQYLVWDNRMDPGPPDIRIYYAKKIDDTMFKYVGEVGGVNVPGAINYEMILDNNNNFYFSRLTPSDRGSGLPNIYRGLWNNGTVTGVAIVPGLNPNLTPVPGRMEIDDSPSPSPDGQLLIFNTEYFAQNCIIYKVALKNADGSFTVLTNDDPRMAKYTQEWHNIYESDHFNQCLNMPQPGSGAGGWGIKNPITAPLSFSHSGLQAVFTVVDPSYGERFFITTRNSLSEPFGTPQLLVANGRVVEGGSFSPDDSHIYFHLSNPDGTFWPYVITRISTAKSQ